MAHVSIIGKGSMGQPISDIVTKGGASVDMFDSSDGDKPLKGDVVVLAVPYSAIPDVLDKHGAQMAGMVVVDITNPVNMQTFDSLEVPPDSSAAAEIQQRLPDAKVLKALNTNFAATLAAGSVGPVRTTVLIAGDDQDAKDTFGGIINAGGLPTLNVGSLRRARELEALGFLQLSLAVGEQLPWTGGFGVIS